MFNEAAKVVVAEISGRSFVHYGEAIISDASVPPILHLSPEELLRPVKPVRTAIFGDGSKVWETDSWCLIPSETPPQEIDFDFSTRKPDEGSLSEKLVIKYAKEMGYDFELQKEGDAQSKGQILFDRRFIKGDSDLRKLLIITNISV